APEEAEHAAAVARLELARDQALHERPVAEERPDRCDHGRPGRPGARALGPAPLLARHREPRDGALVGVAHLVVAGLALHLLHPVLGTAQRLLGAPDVDLRRALAEV